MFKKILSILLAISVLLPVTSTFAAGALAPDLIVTDIRIVPGNYKVGDNVAIELDVKNIGTAPMKLGWFGLQNLVGIKHLVRVNNWTRPRIFPGQTITCCQDNFLITAEDVSITGLCNSANNAAEPNKSNNKLTKTFSVNKTNVNLAIENVKIVEVKTDDVRTAAFEITYKNTGKATIPYSNIEIELTVDSQKYIVKETTDLKGNETRKIKSDTIHLNGDTVKLSAYINPKETVNEEIYDDNEFVKEFNLVNDVSEKYTWQVARVGGGGWPRSGFVNEFAEGQVFQLADVNGLFKYNQNTGYNECLTQNTGMGIAELGFGGYKQALGVEQDPNNLDTIFFAGGQDRALEGLKGSSYVMRTFDGGKTWESMNAPFYFTEPMTWGNAIMDLDPKNSNVLYVAGLIGLYRTTNAQERVPVWEKLPVPGLKEVTNNGNSSDPKVKHQTVVECVVVDINSEVKNGLSQDVYVGVRGLGVLKSNDGGNSFALIEGCPTGDIYSLRVDSEGNVLAAGSYGLFKYYKDTKTWVDISPQPGIKTYANVHPYDASLVAATSPATNTLHISVDGGLTWRELLSKRKLVWAVDPKTGVEKYMPNVINMTSWGQYHHAANGVSWVAFDPFTPNRLFYNGWFGTYQILDYTKEEIDVEEITYGIEEGFVRSLLPLPEGADSLMLHGTNDFCGVSYNNIFEFTAERFLPHTQETTGLAYMVSNPNFVVRNGGTGRGAGAGNGFYSYDCGKTWTEFPTYPMKNNGTERQQAGKIVCASDVNENGVPTIMIVTLGNDTTIPADSTHARVWRTEDLGQTWTWVESLPVNAIERFLDLCEPLVADKVNKDKFYFYDFRTGSVYKSVDNGKNFSIVGSLPMGDTESNMVATDKEGELFVSISYSGLWHSTDGGATWKQIENVDRARFFDVGKSAPCCPQNPALYVLGEVEGNYGVFRSIDMGESWVKIDDPKEHEIWNKLTTLKADKRTFGQVYIGTDGSGVIVGYPGEDKQQPMANVYEFIDGKIVNTPQITVTGGSTKPGTAVFTVNGVTQTITLDEDNMYETTLNLNVGENKILFHAEDVTGYKSMERSYTVTYDPAYVGIKAKVDKASTADTSYTIEGRIDTNPKVVRLYVNGSEISLDRTSGNFAHKVNLQVGLNTYEIKAVSNGITETKTVVIDRDLIPPVVSVTNMPAFTSDPLLVVNATINEPGTISVGDKVYKISNMNEATIKIPMNLSPGENVLEIKSVDVSGNENSQKFAVTFQPDELFSQVSTNEVIAYTNTPTIDGVLDENWVLNRVIAKKVDSDPKSYGKFGLMSDEDNLYIAIQVYDDKVCPDVTEYSSDYKQDTVEVHIDGGLERSAKYDGNDTQLRFGIGGKPYLASKSAPLDAATSASTITKDGYIIEIAIPWYAVYTEYAPGKKFGIEISINDCEIGGTRSGVMTWVGDGTAWQSLANAGTGYMGSK